jgi:hypothetical protein
MTPASPRPRPPALRWCAGLALLLAFPAEAGGLAGVRLDRASGLGLGAPRPIQEADIWKASCPGGFVMVSWSPDDATAQADLAWQASILRSSLGSLSIEGADEARGDEGLVLARRGNVLALARCDDAITRAKALIAAIEPEPGPGSAAGPVPASSPTSPGGSAGSAGASPPDPLRNPVEARDAFGRRAGSTAADR